MEEIEEEAEDLVVIVVDVVSEEDMEEMKVDEEVSVVVAEETEVSKMFILKKGALTKSSENICILQRSFVMRHFYYQYQFHE